MTSAQSTRQPIFQANTLQVYNTVNLESSLQSELAVLQAKVVMYYNNEIVLRGDKVMMREYCKYFGIEVTKSDIF